MFLLLVGFLGMVFLGLELFRKGLSALIFPRNLFESLSLLKKKDVFSIFKGSLGISFSLLCSQSQVLMAFQALNLRLLPGRSILLLLSTSTLSLSFLIPAIFFLWKWNAYYLAGFLFLVAIVGDLFFSFEKKRKLDSLLLIGVGCVLFFGGYDLLLRHNALLQNFLIETDMAFFLLDRRWESLGFVGLAGFLLSFILPSHWSVILGLWLYPLGVLSLPGFVMILSSEKFASILKVFLLWRKADYFTQKLAKRWFYVFLLLNFLAMVSSLFVLSELRILNAEYFKAFQDLPVLTFQILLMVLWIHGVLFLGGMLWGHLLAQKDENLIENKSLETSYRLELPRSGLLESKDWLKIYKKWLVQALDKRISEMNYQLHGLASLSTEKIPHSLQKRLLEESGDLIKLLERLKKTF